MSHLPNLIADLALILISAGVITLLFKKLKQPLVLGYIVAGFLVGPHTFITPSVVDTGNIQTWSDIGVIFLLFALGLEFSFKKILKVGGSAIIAACTIIFCMILVGITVGIGFGWKRMDCIFLGGMIAMSSTTIIYKAFDDLGLRKKKFAGLVLSILILEDILAIVLMVVLSTMAVSNNFQGSDLIGSIGKLVFFLVLWFVVGILLIPGFLKKAKKLMSDETLLIVALGMCFGMVVTASQVGFSPAFGAFIMGSILAETIEAEHIEVLVKPVKDLFGAIFFVSVGMMVDPAMIVEYAIPIAVISLVVILGQSLFGTFGVLLSGQPLKTAMQCGFSLTQIGEFAFIIASLGVSLKVTSHFLYPIVVAVSVITTFLTPYMIRLAEPASDRTERSLPLSWKRFLDRYSSGSSTVNYENNWRKLLLAMGRNIVIYSIISIAVIILSFRFVAPLFQAHLPSFLSSLAGSLFTILCISPFLRAIVVKKNHSVEFVTLWEDNSVNRGPLVSTIVLRVVIAVVFVTFIIAHFFKASVGIILGVAVILVFFMIYSRVLKKNSILLERRFLQNLRLRDVHAEYMGKKKPAYAGKLLSRDIHLADFEIPGESPWAGKTLAELNLGKEYGVHIVSILRGRQRINIPGASVMLFPMDKIQAIGTDEQLNLFNENMMKELSQAEGLDLEKSIMALKQFMIDAHSGFLGKSIRESGIRDKYRCLIVGVERGGNTLRTPDVNVPFQEGDVVWVVGEQEDVYSLVNKKG
ncbi:cation:proton antiporter [Bacteroides sedimenti]|uniref:Sodium:proton antiporter n=1 Tax=Bacteroides sedimenti TaxID=2136147 RepID=A0ABN6Z914_9BACE